MAATTRFLVSHVRTKPGILVSRSPVAVMFGWVSAQDRHLQKYGELLHSIGVPSVLRMTVPTPTIFFSPKGVAQVAQQTLETLQSEYPDRPVIMMYFSNGGCFVHEQIIKLLGEEQRKPAATKQFSSVQLSGCIFDSAPAWLSPSAGGRALTESIRSPLLRGLAFWVARSLFTLLAPVWFGWRRSARYFDALENDNTAMRSLYIFSRVDRITDHIKLVELIEKRRDNGAVITSRVFPDSPHVGHYARHPVEYKETIASFLSSLVGCTQVVSPEANQRIR